ncbi:MAG: hypothetical protein KDA41_13115 [Planctomycetales bacterium]|nr:hypothetical protein [Planctomycetales bacterium]
MHKDVLAVTRRNTPRALVGAAWALAVCLAASGCRLSEMKPQSVWPMDTATSAQTPDSMVAVWSDTVMYTPGLPPTRGFGGRLYFYDRRHDAVKVDGQLVVYVYDDSEHATDKDEPQRKYVFTAEQFSRHCSGSELGPSYSVWIPWDEVGGPTQQLSLVPMFIAEKGGVVMGEHTRHRLPGAVERKDAAPSAEPRRIYGAHVAQPPAPNDLRPVSYEETVVEQRASDRQAATSSTVQPAAHAVARENLAGPPSSLAQLRTTTINIAPSTRDRLANSYVPATIERNAVAPRSAEEVAARWQRYGRTSADTAHSSTAINPAAAPEGPQGAPRMDPPAATSPAPTRPIASSRFAPRPRPAPARRFDQSFDDRNPTPPGREESPYVPPSQSTTALPVAAPATW